MKEKESASDKPIVLGLFRVLNHRWSGDSGIILLYPTQVQSVARPSF